ncbi:MAG: dTMP kinase [Xanthomonadaceae bacterium]|nr:dTMP kinase [Xanthomonadaceae bacterium]
MGKKGLFITIEGTEGSGKSTLINGLALALGGRGVQVLRTREPGGHPLAERIRELILNEEMEPWTEVFLYEASRAEHVSQVIRKAVDKNMIVLCDRFTASTLAYQSVARGLPWKVIETLNTLAIQGMKPDFNIFLDLDPKLGLSRANDPNRFEKESLGFHQKVRSGFLKIVKKNKKEWIHIKVDKKGPQEVLREVLIQMKKKLPKQLKGITNV